MTNDGPSIFTRLAPVLNVRDLAAERRFYESCWQLVVSDVDAAAERCRAAGLEFELEQHGPAPGWSYRRLVLESPSGYRVALEGPRES